MQLNHIQARDARSSIVQQLRQDNYMREVMGHFFLRSHTRYSHSYSPSFSVLFSQSVLCCNRCSASFSSEQCDNLPNLAGGKSHESKRHNFKWPTFEGSCGLLYASGAQQWVLLFAFAKKMKIPINYFLPVQGNRCQTGLIVNWARCNNHCNRAVILHISDLANPHRIGAHLSHCGVASQALLLHAGGNSLFLSKM